MAAAESDDEVPSTSHSIVSAFEEQVFVDDHAYIAVTLNLKLRAVALTTDVIALMMVKTLKTAFILLS